MGLISYLRGSREKTAPQTPAEEPLVPKGFPTDVDPRLGVDKRLSSYISFISKQETLRPVRYSLFDRMDTGDIAALLTTVKNDLLTFDKTNNERGFKVEANPRLQKRLEAIIKRAKINEALDEITYDTLKYGDGFTEPIYSSIDGWLIGLQRYEPAQIFIQKDDKNQFVNTVDQQGFPLAYQQKYAGRVVAGWYSDQIVHFKADPRSNLRYSRTGLLDGISLDWKKLLLIEAAQVVARLTRAHPRNIHTLDHTGKDAEASKVSMLEYIRNISKTAFGKKPKDSDGLPTVDVSEDFYISKKLIQGPDGKLYPSINGIESIDPSIAGLAEISDIDYLRRKLFNTVPSDVIGIKKNTTGDIDAQDIAFTNFLHSIQKQLEIGLRQILDQALFAEGVLDAEYSIIFPTIVVNSDWRFADAAHKDSMKYRNWIEIGALTRKTALQLALNFTSAEADTELSALKDEYKDLKDVLTLIGQIKQQQPTAATNPATVGKQGKASQGFRGG